MTANDCVGWVLSLLASRDFQMDNYERMYSIQIIQAQVRRKQAQKALRETMNKVEVMARMRLAAKRKEQKRIQKQQVQLELARQEEEAHAEVTQRRKGAIARAAWR